MFFVKLTSKFHLNSVSTAKIRVGFTHNAYSSLYSMSSNPIYLLLIKPGVLFGGDKATESFTEPVIMKNNKALQIKAKSTVIIAH